MFLDENLKIFEKYCICGIFPLVIFKQHSTLLCVFGGHKTLRFKETLQIILEPLG